MHNKWAEIPHHCGEVIIQNYARMIDVFSNPTWCPRCLMKFYPMRVLFKPNEDDGSISFGNKPSIELKGRCND